MKELVFHRGFFPAMDRLATKVGFHDGDYHATFAEHGDRVLRLADAMRTELGVRRGDRVRGDVGQQPPVPRAVPRRLPGRRHRQPAEPAAGREGAAVHPRRLGHRGGVRRRVVRRPLRPQHRRGPRPARHCATSCSSATATCPTTCATRTSSASGRPVVPDEPDEDDPVVLMYTGRHHRPAQGRAARPARRDAEPVPHRHDGRLPRQPRLPAPDPDVPRRLDGRRPRHPRHRRPVGVRPAVRAGPGDGAHRAVPGRLDGDGADDDRHAARPSRVPPRAPGVAERPRLRRVADAGRAARPRAVDSCPASACGRATG